MTMKINAVYDKSGCILAVSRAGGEYEGPKPVAGKDQEMAVIAVPADLAAASLEDICLNYRVDARMKTLCKG